MGSTEVLVIGAGPTGLALACGLRQHGVPVRVLDRAQRPATASRANILHARGVEVLNRLGALGDLPDRSVRAVEMTIHLDTKPLVTVRFGEVENAQLSALLVSQAEVEAQLRHRLAELDGTVEFGRELVDAVQDGDGVTATLSSGEIIRSPWLVGCDGAHSTVRKQAEIGFPGASVTDEWLLADVHADWDADRTGSAGWYHRDGLFFAMPMRDPGNDLWRLMADVPLPDREQPGDDEILDRFRHLLPERTGLTGVRLRDATWTSVFRIHRRLAERYRNGRFLLAGDAAHIHSPFGGQGMNTGIGDAENLAWKLALVAQGRADAALLDTYQAERRPLAEDVLRNTTANTRILTAEGKLGRFLRDRVLTPLANLPAVQRRATWLASQLWVTYCRGPLGARHWRRPRPGDRVVDRECRDVDGRGTRLHAELSGRWAMLVPDSANAKTPPALGDHVVTLKPRAPWSEVWLVRPDAHLAWRGKAGSHALAHWLDRALLSGKAP